MRRGSCVICVQFFFSWKKAPIVGKIQVWCFSLFSPAWFKCQNTMDLKHIPFCCSIAQLLVFRLLNYDHLDVYPNILSCKRNLSSISAVKKKLSHLNLIIYSTTMKWIGWLTIVTQLPDSCGTFAAQKIYWNSLPEDARSVDIAAVRSFCFVYLNFDQWLSFIAINIYWRSHSRFLNKLW